MRCEIIVTFVGKVMIMVIIMQVARFRLVLLFEASHLIPFFDRLCCCIMVAFHGEVMEIDAGPR